MADVVSAVAYQQLPTDTKTKITDLATKNGYDAIEYDWNGTIGSTDLLVNGKTADNNVTFTIGTDHSSRLCNFILSNIADDFKIEVIDKNSAGLTLPEVYQTDLYQFPTVEDSELAKLNSVSFIRKLINEGKLGRNKLIEIVKPTSVTNYANNNEFTISITNNSTTYTFTIIFKTNVTIDKTLATVTIPGASFTTTGSLNNSVLDNIFPIVQKTFSVLEKDSKNSFNSFKTENSSRIVVYNKQLLKYTQFLKGNQTAANYNTASGLSWVDTFSLRTETLPTASYDFITNPNSGDVLDLVTTMSLKAFSLPILVNIVGQDSNSAGDTSTVKNTIFNSCLVKPYLGTAKAVIDNNEIVIPETDGDGTYNYEKELKYPDLSDVLKSYSDTDTMGSVMTYTAEFTRDNYSLKVEPVEVSNKKTGKFKYIAHYPRATDGTSEDIVVSMNLTTTFKAYSYTETINVGTANASGSIIFNEGNQISIMKGESAEFTFKGTKAAKVEFNIDSDATDPTKALTGVTITATLDNTGTLPNELGEKYYMNFTGKGVVTADATATVTSYKMSYNLLNSDGSIIGTGSYTVNVSKPLPKPAITSATTLQINKDVKTKLTISATQITQVEIKEAPKLTTATISNQKHSKDKNDSETYDEYTFNITFTPKGNAGNEEMILVLSNDDKSVSKEVSIILNVYDPIHTSVEEWMRVLDYEAGHKVNFSYNEKNGYNLPAAFVTGGEEVASVLVAKYPVSQEAINANTDVEETLNNLSKPHRSRVRVYSDSKVEDNKKSEGGELHKIINPNALVKVLDNIKSGKLLNGNAHPVLNSAALDTMIANMLDAQFIYGVENNTNIDVSLKPLYPKDITNSTSENIVSLTGYKYNLIPVINRTTEHSYSTVDEKNDKLYSQGAIWNVGNKHYDVSNTSVVESTSETILGEMNSVAYDTLKRDKVIAFPIIPSDLNTHNGEANGIVDMFGAGIKVYSDLLYTYEDEVDKLKILDPYTTKVEYDAATYATRENNFVEIPYNANSFMANTDSVAYIGTNENKPDRLSTRSVFSNYSYNDFKYGYLMDSVGLPMDNSVMDYPNDITFKGNAGFSSVPNWQYGRSAYYVDYRQITDNGGTKGYFVTGSVGNGKLLFGNSDEIHNNQLDWAKLYPKDKNIFTGKDDIGLGKATAGNRSRILLHENVQYGINKKTGYTDDNLYYNNRLHFLIFDTDRIERNPLVNLKVNNKFIELEETKSTKLDVTTDGKLSIGDYDKNGINVDLDAMTVTGIKAGTYEFTISATDTNKDTATTKVYVKVDDLLAPTTLTADVYDVIGKTDDTVYIEVTTNATDISTIMTSAHATIETKERYTPADVTPTTFRIGIKLVAVTKPETSLLISATAPNSKTASLEIPIVIKQRIETKYEVLVKNFTVNTKAELQGQLNSDYLAKKLNLVSSGITIDNPRSVCIWSTQLAGQSWRVNSDYTFSIDFGNSTYSVYTINYEAQIDQEYEYDGIIPATKPAAKVENNRNNVVSGTINIYVLITDEATIKGAQLTSAITDDTVTGGVKYTKGIVAVRKPITTAEYSFSPANIGKVVSIEADPNESGKEYITIQMADVIENDTIFIFTMSTSYQGMSVEKINLTLNAKSNINGVPIFDQTSYTVDSGGTVTGTVTVSDHVTIRGILDPNIGEITFTKQ